MNVRSRICFIRREGFARERMRHVDDCFAHAAHALKKPATRLLSHLARARFVGSSSSEQSMEELVSRISQASNLDSATAQQAIVAVLGFLRREGPPAEVDQLFAAVPGADAVVRPEEGGAASAFGGGGLMGLAGRLTGLGLGMGDMQTVGRELFAYAREKAGDDTVGQIAGAIPGLAQFV
jgi:hypothetical protein